ncbi:MAG: EamA family transporter [bacterium]|nr:EamA family transporter [bacterium]
MIPFESVALLPALFFSLSGIFTRMGIDESTPHTGSLIVNLVYFAASVAALLFVDFSAISFNWYWLAFIAAGLASPALSLFFMYRAIQQIGVASNSSLVNSNAIFGAFWAFLLLGERPSALVWSGIALVVAGVYIISGGVQMKGKNKYLLLSIFSAICFGLAHTFRKMGFGGMDSILFGGFLQGLSAAAATPFLLSMANRGKPYVFSRLGVHKFLIAGFFMICAQYGLLLALRWGEVSRVAPLVSTGPLFTLVLVRLILGKKEPITKRITGGALLIVTGVILVVLLR